MINISNPCPQKWESMTPATGGNYCDQCCKVVVDFSDCSNEEIANYFTSNIGKRICGRFKAGQVSAPKTKNKISRFLAALVIAFGSFLFSSCNENKPEHTIGDSIYISDSMRNVIEKQVKIDSTKMADSISRLKQPK